jgi:hypothetical protein
MSTGYIGARKKPCYYGSMTFTKPEQIKHRKAFIDECRQKAWGAACHADWIAKGIEGLVAHFEKLQAEDRALDEAIKGRTMPSTTTPSRTGTSARPSKSAATKALSR